MMFLVLMTFTFAKGFVVAKKKEVAVVVEPVPTMAEVAGTGEKKMSKMKAVEAAMGQGLEKPAEIVAWIAANLGMDVKPQMASMYRSKIIKRADTAPPSSSGGRGKSSGGAMGGDLVALRSLVSRLGADDVKSLVDFIAK